MTAELIREVLGYLDSGGQCTDTIENYARRLATELARVAGELESAIHFATARTAEGERLEARVIAAESLVKQQAAGLAAAAGVSARQCPAA